MVLIICPNCGASISDKAISCPKCKASSKVLNIKLSSAYLKFWFHSFDFKGTSFRREFWYGLIAATLTNIILFLILGLLFEINDNPGIDISVFTGFYALLVIIHFWGSLIPIFSSTIRRIRHAGRSPYFILWNLLPVVGQLMTLVVLFETKNRKMLG
tara:strand:- start:1016 stop:1486 length:471 start_codon:yes stop_codon:yes gene_type:complete